MSDFKKGKIGRIEEFGLGVLIDETSLTAYPFSLDKLKGYRGEPINTLPLKKNSPVEFLIENDKVISVIPQNLNKLAAS